MEKFKRIILFWVEDNIGRIDPSVPPKSRGGVFNHVMYYRLNEDGTREEIPLQVEFPEDLAKKLTGQNDAVIMKRLKEYFTIHDKSGKEIEIETYW